MTGPRLTPEQRRALAMLATADRNGAPQALLSAHGFDAIMIAGLVNQGLATLTTEKVRAGGKLIAVAKVRITEAGREVLGKVGKASVKVERRTDHNQIPVLFAAGRALVWHPPLSPPHA